MQIDLSFVSEANLDCAAKHMIEGDWFVSAGNHDYSKYVGEAKEGAVVATRGDDGGIDLSGTHAVADDKDNVAGTLGLGLLLDRLIALAHCQ